MLSRSTMLVSLVLGLSSVAHAGIPSYVTKPTATSVVYALPYETATPTKAVVRRADFPTSLTKPAIIGGGYGTLPYETATKAIGRRADFTTVLPASAGYTALPTARVISGKFDGKMVKFDRKGSSGACQGQSETGEAQAVFILESGASISNVIIGKDQAEGIHCRGPCNVTNVWWEDVCEDAITIKQTGDKDVSYINGGGAFKAEDKIVQHNGAGRVSISNFFASDFGKLYRACGNCSKSYARSVTLNNVCLKGGKEGVGINSNFGDTATLTNVKTNGNPSSSNVCCTYKGVGSGSEPTKIGCGSSYSACKISGAGTC